MTGGPDPSRTGARPLRLLFVATSYPRDLGDWRGLFIRHMAFALARSGAVSLRMWCPPGERPVGATSAATPEDDAWLGRLMSAGGIAHLMRAGGLAGLAAPMVMLHRLSRLFRREREADLYHLNWLQTALPLPSDGKPLLVTVLGNDLRLLRLPLVRPLLRRAMRGRRVMVCPNAEWMEAPLRAAFGDIAEVRAIVFGVAREWFDIERAPVQDGPHRWLAVTRLTAAKLGPLLEWGASQFTDGRRELHLFGPMQEQIALPDWVHYHGPATPQDLQSNWFPRATGLVTLSRHDEGRPQVMLEAMASGLPIVASALPAHAALVAAGETGALCDSPEGFAQALAAVEEPDANERMCRAARARARAEFGTWDDCARRYLDAYTQLAGGIR